jgi:Ca2+-binding EF-hand superfamily protein
MQTLHNGKYCWTLRGIKRRKMIYIFHNGDKRWVVSKRIDQGAYCYAYVEDDTGRSPDPSACTSPWFTCLEDMRWGVDDKLKCEAVPPSADKFAKFRVALEDEMRRYGIIDTGSLRQLWRLVDVTGAGYVSIRDIMRLVGDLLISGNWPDWMGRREAIEMACEAARCSDGPPRQAAANARARSVLAATQVKGVTSEAAFGRQETEQEDELEVDKEDFHAFLLNVFWFAKMRVIFNGMDADNDGRLSLNEFVAGLARLGLKLSETEARTEFESVDSAGNGDGMVSFEELCVHLRLRVNPDDNQGFDSEAMQQSSAQSCAAFRRWQGNRATHGQFVSKKTLRVFDELEHRLLLAITDHSAIRRLWRAIDINSNNVVSLAELDRFVVELFPLLNHKPALVRAYKNSVNRACSTPDASDESSYVLKRDFKKLLLNIFYYNKLSWMFDHVEDDQNRRFVFDDFKWCAAICGCRLEREAAAAEFGSIATTQSGTISFDDFCTWVGNQMLQRLLGDGFDEDGACSVMSGMTSAATTRSGWSRRSQPLLAADAGPIFAVPAHPAPDLVQFHASGDLSQPHGASPSGGDGDAFVPGSLRPEQFIRLGDGVDVLRLGAVGPVASSGNPQEWTYEIRNRKLAKLKVEVKLAPGAQNVCWKDLQGQHGHALSVR